MWAKEKITGLNQRQKLAKKILTKARAKLQFVVQKSIKSSMAKKWEISASSVQDQQG